MPLATDTFTFTACELMMVPAIWGEGDSILLFRMPCCPTKPPAFTPLTDRPLTLLSFTVTLVMVPPLWPARTPTHCETGGPYLGCSKPILATTLALAILRLLTEPVSPMVPNRPTLCVVALLGAITRPLMVKPWPLRPPVKKLLLR